MSAWSHAVDALAREQLLCSLAFAGLAVAVWSLVLTLLAWTPWGVIARIEMRDALKRQFKRLLGAVARRWRTL